jgi:hypothetical protein
MVICTMLMIRYLLSIIDLRMLWMLFMSNYFTMEHWGSDVKLIFCAVNAPIEYGFILDITSSPKFLFQILSCLERRSIEMN